MDVLLILRGLLLNRKFGDYWICWSENNRWAACSPDLTPIDFYLWRKLKQQVYSEMPITREDMKEHIRRACVAIDPNQFVLQCYIICVDTFQKMRQCSWLLF